MPGIAAVAQRLVGDLGQASFLQSLLGTLGRLGAGTAWRWTAGIGFGLVAAVLFFFREVLRSAITSSCSRSVRSPGCRCSLIVMGFGNTPIIVVVALSAFFPAALSVMNATGVR